MEYHQSVKKSGIQPFATKWSKLEINIFSEISHTPKTQISCVLANMVNFHAKYKTDGYIGKQVNTYILKHKLYNGD